MANFHYKGRQNGQLVEGAIEAASADTVASTLADRGIIPIHIEEASADIEVAGVKNPFRRKVKLADLVMFCRQMHTLTKAGVPLVRAMRGLAENTGEPKMREILADVAEDVESGLSLSASLNRHPDTFTSLFISLIRVGENTGKLDQTFLQISSYLELEHETKHRIKAAMRYPIFVISAIIVALIIVNVLVIPEFKKIFDSFNAELPLPTRILIGVSDFSVAYWPYISAVVVLMVVGLISYLKTPQGRYQWHYLILRLPIVGHIFEKAVLGRFCRSLSVMLSAGVPIIKALLVVSQAVGNDFMSRRIDGIREFTEAGHSLTQSSASSNLFTPLVLQMISVGEETGAVDQLLIEVAEFYEREVDYSVKNLSSSIEPLLVVVIGAMVLVLALGVFLPLWELSSAISS